MKYYIYINILIIIGFSDDELVRVYRYCYIGYKFVVCTYIWVFLCVCVYLFVNVWRIGGDKEYVFWFI